MDKKQFIKILCTAAIPAAVIIIILLIISKNVAKELPLWAIVSVCVALVISPFLLFLHLYKRLSTSNNNENTKKFAKYASIFYIVFVIVLLVVTYILNKQFFLPFLLCQLPMLAYFVYVFLKKQQ